MYLPPARQTAPVGVLLFLDHRANFLKMHAIFRCGEVNAVQFARGLLIEVIEVVNPLVVIEPLIAHPGNEGWLIDHRLRTLRAK